MFVEGLLCARYCFGYKVSEWLNRVTYYLFLNLSQISNFSTFYFSPLVVVNIGDFDYLVVPTH